MSEGSSRFLPQEGGGGWGGLRGYVSRRVCVIIALPARRSGTTLLLSRAMQPVRLLASSPKGCRGIAAYRDWPVCRDKWNRTYGRGWGVWGGWGGREVRGG